MLATRKAIVADAAELAVEPAGALGEAAAWRGGWRRRRARSTRARSGCRRWRWRVGDEARCCYLSAAVLVVVCATWAYRVNYATQEAMDRVADLRAQIAAEREAIAVLNAEWAYLNRPDRLRALVAANAAALGLAELTPDQFGEAAMVAYPAGTRRPRRRRGRHRRRSRAMIRRPLRPLARILQRPRRGQGPGPRRGRGARRAAGGAAPRRAGQGRDAAAAARGGVHPRLLHRRGAHGAGLGGGAGRAAGGLPGEPIHTQRADIVDRNGAVLATNIVTASLYAQPAEMIDPRGRGRGAGGDLPRPRRAASSTRSFTDGRKFLWIKRTISPEQRQRVHDLGEPGLLFGPRETRLYPNGAVAAHVLGGASFGREGVRRRRGGRHRRGGAGVRRAAARSGAGRTSRCGSRSTSRCRRRSRTCWRQGMAEMHAKGAVGILMEADTGQIRALASLPDFDPNLRPPLPTQGDPADSPLFNRAAQGRYELGSVFKPFTVAMALEAGLVDAADPGRHQVADALGAASPSATSTTTGRG